MFKLLRCIFKGHKRVFVRNVYGDEAMRLDARSVWKCSHCGLNIYSHHIHPKNIPLKA